jgi:hypothetical protein
MRIWFHGTNRAASQAIIEQGFREESWFAESLEDAIEFGGEYVFEVAFDYMPVIPGNWQMRVSEAVPVECIVRLTKYNPKILADYPDRRIAVFQTTREMASV